MAAVRDHRHRDIRQACMTAVDLGAAAFAHPFLGCIFANAARFGGAPAKVADHVAEPLAGILPVPLEVARAWRLGRLRGSDHLPQTVVTVYPGDVDAAG